MNYTEDIDFSVYPSMLQEYLYCKRFIYFMFVLDIPQREGSRYKVLKGREKHEEKSHYKYVPVGTLEKKTNVTLYSDKHRLHGVVDEVHFLVDSTAAILDYKFAEYKGVIWDTLKYQAVLYSTLVEDTYNVKCRKAFICYTRSQNKTVELKIEPEDYNRLFEFCDEIEYIIDRGFFPDVMVNENKCSDCTYRNICPK